MDAKKRKFAEIYDENIDKIFRFVYLKVGSVEISQDLTGQVFSKGWEKFAGKEKLKNPSAYLYQIARSEIANYYRVKDKLKIAPINEDILETDSLNLEEQRAKTEEIEEMRVKLACLDDEQQNLLIWRYVDNLSIRQVAKLAHRPSNTTRVMIHRALKELKEGMKGEV